MRSILWWLLPVLTGCSMFAVGPFPKTTVPSELAAAPNERLIMVASAQGAQIYRCDPKKEAPGQFEWIFQSPEASLVDESGKKAGKHYAGPTWEALDGSKIVGTVQARKDAPEKSAIPWLRLAARSTGGAGRLANVTTVLRVSTVGGLSPAGACTAADQGRILRVDYTADYYMYAPK